MVFCDLAGSTALGESVDPERLRALLARYFGRMKGIVESHGGTVEKFIGDAVMAVFGVPTLHEDDALRAVRAAVEMRDALPELGLEGRIGVMTGEVVTGTEERLVTGDAVNVAARLEQAAQPGEVLIGDPTLTLVREAVEVEAVVPLRLKGKTQPVPAHRLLAVHAEPERRHDTPFVGRQRELALIRSAWQRTADERRCELVTVVGDAGIGKSRLVAEALSEIDATVVRGRCLTYGDGITYWPVVEVLKQLDERPADERAATAIHALLGESEASTSADEIAWAFRKTLERAGATRPVVVVFDDVQWGEDTFLDLVEHISLLSTGAPILLLCMARPELVEQRPTWPVTLRLEPLVEDDVDRLMPERISGTLRERIANAAGGNPLFVGEMLAMAVEASHDVVVPPTLRALIAARLDRLQIDERRVLERGAVEGEIFHRGALQAIAPEEEQVTPRLAALVRKDVIRPDAPLIAGDDGFRFRHLLIRDAAYDGLPKSTRAELHERFATWLEEHGSDLVELDEILGYHLEQAWRYHAELGTSSCHGAWLATAAHRRLARAGSRANHRQDFSAGLNLLERAAAMRDDAPLDPRMEVDLAWARFSAGQDPDKVLSTLAEVADRAEQAGDHLAALALRLDYHAYEVVFRPTAESNERLGELVDEALPLFAEAGDDWGAALAYSGRALALEARAGLQAEIVGACSHMLEHARRADSRLLVDWAEDHLVLHQLQGATPVEECLRWLDANPEVERRSVLPRRDGLLAQLGRFEEAHELLAVSATLVAERGSPLASRSLATRRFDVAMLEGDAAAAEAAARAALGRRRLRLGHLRLQRGQDVPDLLVDDRLEHPLAHRADRAGDLHVRHPVHRGVVALARERERGVHVHHRADARALRLQLGVLERALGRLLERDRHLQPAEPERHLHLGGPVVRVLDLEALHARHQPDHLGGVVDHAPDHLARGVELLRPVHVHLEVTFTFARVLSGSRSISQTRW